MNDMEIRYAREEDVSTLEACQVAAFAFPFKSEDMRKFLDNPLFKIRVLTVEGAVVGHYVVYFIDDSAELLSIAVNEADRGKGYGKKLLDDVFSVAKELNCGQIILDVRESNSKAIGLYKKAGFETLVRRKDFYQRPREDGFTMMAVLKGNLT